TVNGLTATLQYDYENRLVRINYPAQSGGGWTEFVYDALGRRLKTIEKNAQGAVTSEWHYAYDGLDMIGCSTEATLWWQASRMARALTIR
ncbi:hypothetical protein HZA56_11845, partial [Candidatus Poribacteria bacterium]|nr:hypothetical protein [Candidatus Poribacteria bacterium]